MDAMIAKFERQWRSERLIYRPIEDTDECKDFLYKVMADPVLAGLSNPNAPRPCRKSEMKNMVEQMTKDSIVSLMVFIDPTHADAPATAPDDKKTEGQGQGDGAAKDAPPQAVGPIGFLDLTCRGPWKTSASTGICFLNGHQNKGYGREAITFLLDYGFRWANLHRISIGTASFNERALHLYRSLGFFEEGRKREMFYMDLGWHDLVEFSMIVHEWKALQGIDQ